MNFLSGSFLPKLALGLAFATAQSIWGLKFQSEIDRFNHKLRQRFYRKIDITDEFHKEVLIFTGNSNQALASEIASILKMKLGEIKVGRFRDGEVNIQVKQNVRGKHIFIVQPTCPPVNESLMELLLMVSTMRRASSGKINVVIPYYGYARQDRKSAPRVPISAADVARLLETVGVDRVVVMDLHSGQEQGFFSPQVPCDNLEAVHVAINYFKYQSAINLDQSVVVSPDAGGVSRAKAFLEMMVSNGFKNVSLAMIIKQRDGPGKIGSMHLVGNVQGKHAIVIDDIIDSAGTLAQASRHLKRNGALSVHAFATHGLFNDPAFQNIKNSSIDRIITTNTIPPREGQHQVGDKIIRLSVAPILAEAIFRIETNTSLSSLFKSKS